MTAPTLERELVAEAVERAGRLYADYLASGRGRRWPEWMDPNQRTQLLAGSLRWVAWAAGEYPGPMLDDAAAVEQYHPELAADAWHLAAGACCLCACNPPAWHRDQLDQLARRLEATIVSCYACSAAPGEACRPWCLAK